MSRLLEPPAGRQVFTIDFAPQPSDIDENGHVNNVVYLRHEIDYRRELKLGETAHGRTWVSETAEGPRFDRYVRIDGPDGAMCAQLVTTWVLIEQATGKPRRVPSWMLEMFG